jgi:hypothetical protein
MAASTTSSIEHQSERGSALPACSRVRSSRFSTSRESRALGVDHRDELAPLVVAEGWRAKAARRGGDRGEGRAQVVRDRTQQRRLHHVAAPERLRLDHLGLELAAAASGANERLESRHDTVLERVEHERVGPGRHQHGSDAASLDYQRQRPPARVRVHPRELH